MITKIKQKVYHKVALCLVMTLIATSVAVFAVPTQAKGAVVYTENNNYIHCTNYYQEGPYYKYQIKIPHGSLSTVTVYEVSLDYYVNLGQLQNGSTRSLTFDYSDGNYNYYTYSVYGHFPGAPKTLWYGLCIKIYYDNGSDHYMATNTSNGSTIEGPGYTLGTP